MVEKIVVIPARLASSRLPRKILLDVEGMPLLVRTAQQVMKSKLPFWVAADSAEVVAVCQEYNLPVVETATHHKSGSDRLAEVAEILGLADDSVMLNVQADEPMMLPSLMNDVIAAVDRHNPVVTAAHPMTVLGDIFNPNVVKVVCNAKEQAVYFSRAPIPWQRETYTYEKADYNSQKQVTVAALRHYGLYAYQVKALRQFVMWPQSPLEKLEALEQLRFLENAVAIKVKVFHGMEMIGVDTKEDLDKVRDYFSSDKCEK